MSKQLFANNATTNLAVSINATQTTITVDFGKGALFPSPTGGDYFIVTLEDVATGDFEIVRATARAGDIMTVVRAQENTVGLVLALGAKVELRITKETLEEIQNLALLAGAQALKFNQIAPQSTWTLIHNLGRYPGVVTFEATFVDPQNPVVGDQIIGDLSYIDENSIEISFGGISVAGVTYLN